MRPAPELMPKRKLPAWDRSPQGALAASRLAGEADLAAVLDQPVAEVDPLGAGYHGHQVALDLLGQLVGRQPQPLGQPLHVGVDHDARGDPVGGPQHDVGRLAADSGQPVRASRSRGISPSCCSANCLAIALRFRALARKKPVDRINSSRSSWSAVAMLAGVGETWNRDRA